VISIINLSLRIGSGIANGDSFEPIFNIITFAIAIILGTGFFEEVLCRGIVMNLIFKNFGRSTRKDIWRAVLLSSLIFSICHYSNMFDGDANFFKCTGQVLFTFGFGAVLGAVYARCHNIWAPIFLHGFWDFANMASKGFFGIGKLLDLSTDEPMTIQYISAILTVGLVFLAILCGISAFMLRKKKIHECFEV
jgi:membrane protease YdiL (CAAX protease family)